ncbi:heavy-metal-associated domain-containing protein [Fulvivirga sp. M361]|uniref:heavy-metal-associated domain-containing protein n=1 Tax=Fulvivirga sp. M361 TaxID=2594266 RepID=UPI00117B5693|nr:heavy metal-associated domain-containing protein [Fulvivirga sp. M361]TRX47269.1 heavy-metal-associated domain-containing protein [Fulvivirga sp. M361]
MHTLKFKSNINCTGCLSKVKPVLDEQKDIHQWNVDLDHEDRILTVEVNDLNPIEVEKTVEKVGFKLELLT